MTFANPVKAVVWKENTLGTLYLNEKGPTFTIGVLNGFCDLGGKSTHDSVINCAASDEFRDATVEDFEKFKVMYSESYQVSKEPPHKTAAAKRVLQLMDSFPDGQNRYNEFVSQVAVELGIRRRQVTVDLTPFI